MKFENTDIWGFEHAIRGMRNPLESWDRIDSEFNYDQCYIDYDIEQCDQCEHFIGYNKPCVPKLGPNDISLGQRLINAGPEHRKWLRQVFVSVDITAPLYWWKEFDTYKIGTVANSTSTMHKLASNPITLDCFETDDLNSDLLFDSQTDCSITENFIPFLENLRIKYLETKDKRYWKELIRWLPESWLQKRTVTLTYENIYSMIRQRKNHKLNEWSGKDNDSLINFISWVKSLPYAYEFLFLGLDGDNK